MEEITNKNIITKDDLFIKDVPNKIPNEIPDKDDLKVSVDSYNQATRSHQLINEYINTATNWKVIVDACEIGRARDISRVPKLDLIEGEKPPAIILGSGPSLDKEIEFLRDWKGGIFATTSQALSLIKHGVEPTHIVDLDPFCSFDEIAGIDWSKTRTKLACHPGVYPDLLAYWPNEIILFIQGGGDYTSFYTDVQKKMYVKRIDQGKGIRDPLFRYYINTELAIFASSPPLQLFIADQLGYGTVFLCGVDFGCPDGKDRFTNYTIKDEFKGLNLDPKEAAEREEIWEKHEHPYTLNENIMISTNGVPSERLHLYYKKNFLSAWRLCGKTLYTTDHGAITEIPYTDIRKLIKKQGLKYPPQSVKTIMNITDEYLAKVDCYIIEAENGGKSFIESFKPETEIPGFMQMLIRTWMCKNCKSKLLATDDIDYTEVECPDCKAKALVRVNPIDYEKNMKRLQILFDNKVKVAEKCQD